jgi:hypothetical protein
VTAEDVGALPSKPQRRPGRRTAHRHTAERN